MKNKKENKCECDRTGTLHKDMINMYDKETELPFVNHKPHKCKCKNDLKLYERNGKKIWLCSCCRLGEKEYKQKLKEVEK